MTKERDVELLSVLTEQMIIHTIKVLREEFTKKATTYEVTKFEAAVAATFSFAGDKS